MNKWEWSRLGKIIAPMSDIPWMSTWCGPAFATVVKGTDLVDIYFSGRGTDNCSRVGRIRIDINDPNKVLQVSKEALFDLGELGTFDENGVSYPWIIEKDGLEILYYVGWMPTLRTPFNLQLGAAKRNSNIENPDNKFIRISRAPILSRTHEEPFSTGSVCVLFDEQEQLFKMWYTSFLGWGLEEGDHKHQYVIKYAYSKDGLIWARDNISCITPINEGEHSICSPSVRFNKHLALWEMWFAFRGEHYQIGYAQSKDGEHWSRQDEKAGLTASGNTKDWDGKAVSYPHVFEHKGKTYMIYSGNEYGKTGIGLSVLKTDL